MSRDKSIIWDEGPVVVDGLIKAMPDGVATPRKELDPRDLLGDPIRNWTLKSVTAEQMDGIFAYIHERGVFLASTEAKMLRPEGGFAVFEYNMVFDKSLKELKSSEAQETQMVWFRKIAAKAHSNEDYPVIYDIWLDEIG